MITKNIAKGKNIIDGANKIFIQDSIKAETEKARKVISFIDNQLGSLEGVLDLNKSDQSISTLPLFYTFGLSIVNTHMFTGGTFFATDKSILQKPFEDEISFFKPTIFSGVPSTYQILKRIDYLHIRQPSIKKITQAGGPLDLATRITDLGKKGSQVNRYKGLGEMNPVQLWETTLDPNARFLLQVKVENEGDAEETFSTLMGEAVEHRRTFIQDNALKVNNLDV